MAILDFQKPDRVIQIEGDDYKGKFEFRPLEPGFGVTVGNAIRRVLLSSLEGFAITSIRIDDVPHEFSSIAGVIEDVMDIILNLKKVRFKQLIEGEDFEKVNVVIGDQKVFQAGDIDKFLSVFQVLNKEQVICNMEPTVKLNIELTIEKGRGYIPSEENRTVNAPIGTIFMDSIHTPILNVKYHTEDYRVEQKTDYEKLVLEIDTDGSIYPVDALKEAAKILIHHFMLFSDEKIIPESEEKNVADEFDESSLHTRQLLKTKLVDLNLSVRALNCLKAAEIDTLGNLVQFQKNDLLKFRNFGKKSLDEIDLLIKTKGLGFGMDVSKYKLDKE
jgi:DNA-directed RNA polymerase subunit alpha